MLIKTGKGKRGERYDTRGQVIKYNKMELMELLDVLDIEKCRKMGSIRVESASIRVKVLRKYNFGTSK